MPRRLFLVELELKEFVKELNKKQCEIEGVFNIIETFIELEEEKQVIQFLSVSELMNEHSQVFYSKTLFNQSRKGRLIKIGERTEISGKEYYDNILTKSNQAIESKTRIVFNYEGLRYSLETNTERDYSVIQVEYSTNEAAIESPLKCFSTVEILGELYMSLEETFARLHLNKKPLSSLQDTMAIFNNNA